MLMPLDDLDKRRVALECEMAELQPAPLLVKLFAAMFDEGQGHNAWRAFVKRANLPVTVIKPGSLEARMWNMILHQQKMLDEAALQRRALVDRLSKVGGRG